MAMPQTTLCHVGNVSTPNLLHLNRGLPKQFHLGTVLGPWSRAFSLQGKGGAFTHAHHRRHQPFPATAFAHRSALGPRQMGEKHEIL